MAREAGGAIQRVGRTVDSGRLRLRVGGDGAGRRRRVPGVVRAEVPSVRRRSRRCNRGTRASGTRSPSRRSSRSPSSRGPCTTPKAGERCWLPAEREAPPVVPGPRRTTSLDIKLSPSEPEELDDHQASRRKVAQGLAAWNREAHPLTSASASFDGVLETHERRVAPAASRTPTDREPVVRFQGSVPCHAKPCLLRAPLPT
jgi:hypothetical protein